MQLEKFDIKKKLSTFYIFNFSIGFVLFTHIIASWLVKRISNTSLVEELNWLLVLFIAISGLLFNYLMFKGVVEKKRYIVKALASFGVGALIVSIYFIVMTNL